VSSSEGRAEPLDRDDKGRALLSRSLPQTLARGVDAPLVATAGQARRGGCHLTPRVRDDVATVTAEPLQAASSTTTTS
jgi:hypothetical protein